MIENRDTWKTPQWLFDKLNKQYTFMFDCCATKKNTKCVLWSDDFLNTKSNTGAYQPRNSWMNPPFSKAREMFEHFFKVINKGVAIYRCDNMETKIWQEIILPNATWVLIPKGRIRYEGFEGKGSRFPSALIGYNVEPPKYLKGALLYIK